MGGELSKDDFVKIDWFDYNVDNEGNQNIDTNSEHIHKELIDVFKLYVTLNSFVDGIAVNKGVGALEYGKRDIAVKGKQEAQPFRRMTKRAAIRKYATKNKIHPRQVKNILVGHDVLVKTGHSKVVNNIYAMFWQPDHMTVGNYKSTVQFLKDAGLYEVLNDDTRESIDNNLIELEKYDNHKTLYWHKLRELEEGIIVNVPCFSDDKRIDMVIDTVTYDLDCDVHINGECYEFKDVRIVKWLK